MKRILTIIAIVVALAAAGVFVYFNGRRYEVVITQAEIDAALSERFPVTKKYLLIFDITYSNPQVTLLENEDRVQVGLDATIDIRIDRERKKLGGGATIVSGIRYDSETQEFFLDDAQITRLEIQGIPDKWLSIVTEVASKAARDYIETKPIYKLKAKDAKMAAAKLLLKDVKVRDQAVHVSLGI